MALCSPGCNDAPITRYDSECEATQNIRKGGLATFIALDCDVTFTDVTDASEWALLGESKYFVAPTSAGTWAEPEQTTETIDCAPDAVVDEVSSANFPIKKFDNTTFKDFDMEFDLKNKLSNKTILIVDCNDILYYNRAWVTGENPGFGGVTAQVFRQSERGSSQVLNVNLSYNTFGTGYKAIKLTQSLKTAIFR